MPHKRRETAPSEEAADTARAMREELLDDQAKSKTTAGLFDSTSTQEFSAASAGSGLDAIAATDFNFEELFAGGEILEDQPPPTPGRAPVEPETSRRDETADFKLAPGTDRVRDEDIFAAVEDLLQGEIESSFGFENSRAVDLESLPPNGGLNDAVPAKAAAEAEAGKTTTDSHVVPYVEVDELLEQSYAENAATPPEEHYARQAFYDEEAPDSGTQPSQQAVEETSSHAAAPSAHAPEEHAAQAATPRGREHAAKNGEPGDDEREKLLIAGLRYYKRGQFDDAIAEFRQTIARYPNFKEAHSILGNAYFRNRMYDDASHAYARVKELDPSDTTAYENMGVIFANRGEYMDAMKEWQRVLEIDPSRDDIRRKIELAARMMMKRASA